MSEDVPKPIDTVKTFFNQYALPDDRTPSVVVQLENVLYNKWGPQAHLRKKYQAFSKDFFTFTQASQNALGDAVCCFNLVGLDDKPKFIQTHSVVDHMAKVGLYTKINNITDIGALSPDFLLTACDWDKDPLLYTHQTAHTINPEASETKDFSAAWKGCTSVEKAEALADWVHVSADQREAVIAAAIPALGQP